MADITLTERIAADNIRIVFGEDSDSIELTEIIRQERNIAGVFYTWRVTLASDINASTVEVTYSNSVSAGNSLPEVADVFYSMLMDAKSTEDANDFISWGRESYSEFSDDAKKSPDALWDEIERAHETYEACKREAEKLRAFLGDKYDAYMWETEYDV
ncbi:hypothetical protein GCM10010149_88350 [Nonomuraea roseoviolacea subsp. roseoviolacea]|uniref:hypothetical protein n=1 Tax=Nonomuraea roseoviolacea TaxID=103837 RepID=UPI0031E0D6AE